MVQYSEWAYTFPVASEDAGDPIDMAPRGRGSPIDRVHVEQEYKEQPLLRASSSLADSPV